MRHALIFFILGASISLFVLNAAALKFDLYYSVWWADIVTHTLGGVILAALLVYLRGDNVGKWKIVLSVLVVGLLWEVFEASTGMTSIEDRGYISDTLGDVFFDVLGAKLLLMSSSFNISKIHDDNR